MRMTEWQFQKPKHWLMNLAMLRICAALVIGGFASTASALEAVPNLSSYYISNGKRRMASRKTSALPRPGP